MVKLDTFDKGQITPEEAIRYSYRTNPKAKGKAGYIRAWVSRSGVLMTHFYDILPKDMGEAVTHTSVLEREEL